MRFFSKIFFLTFLVLSVHASAQTWSIYRGNQQLTGETSAKIPDKPKLLSSFQTGSEIKASPVIDGQTIFCGSTNGTMYAVGFDGKQKWSFVSGNSIEAPALVLNGSVLFGQLDGLFYRLDEKTGKQVWKYKADNQIMGSANWLKVGNKFRLFVGSYDYNLHCFGFIKGDSLWRYESDNYINGTPALYGKYAVFGGCDGFLHLVNIETGKVFKKVKIGTYIASSPVIEGKYAWVGDYEGKFFCIDLELGKIVWTYSDKEKHLPFLASPALSGNLVVIGNQDKFIYCFDKTTGKIVWKVKTSNRVESSSVVASGKVVTGTMDGMLYIHDLKTGNLLWKYELGSAIVGSPAVISGKIVVGAGNRLYIFGN